MEKHFTILCTETCGEKVVCFSYRCLHRRVGFKDLIHVLSLSLQEREEAYQQELERNRIEKEKEIARLRAQQERAKDKQAEKVCTIVNTI